MAPAGGSQSLRQFKVAHLKRKADDELKRGNYGHAADRYSEAIAILVPPATAAAQPLPSLPAGPQHTPTSNARRPTSLELSCPSTSLHTAAADPETSWSSRHSVPDAANHSQQLAAPRVPAGDVAELRVLLSNRSLALLKAGQAAAAVEDASCVIALAPCWPKGHWRMAKALCELKGWSDALDCFARAWSLSEPGSPEQGECEQQLMAVVQRFTRQGLADRLLAVLQSHCWRTQQDQQHPPPMLLTHPVPAGSSQPQLQQSALAAPAGAGPLSDGCETARAAVAEPAVRAVDSTAAAVAELFQACHGEELREAMFHLVKAAQQQQQPPARCAVQTVNKMQALLVKWLVLHVDDYSSSASTSINSANTDSHSKSRGSHVLSSALPAVLGFELQLLTAQLAVKVKRWGTAQVVAADLQHKLAKLVLQDEGLLLQLLVDSHIVLGEALWAAGPDTDCSNSSSSRGGSSAGSSSSTALATRGSTVGDVAVRCQPYKAAAACLTALDLLPVTPSATGSNSSSSSTAASETNRGSCAGPKPSFVQLLLRAGQRLAGDADVVSAAAEQLRKDVQGRLDAALEQLNDLEQAAVWARAAAAGRHGTSPQTEQDSAATTACATKAPAARDAAAAAATGPVVMPCTGSSSTSSSSVSPLKTGWELACIQLGLRQGTSGQGATQVAKDQQSLLVTVRVEALKHSAQLYDSYSADPHANSGSSTCRDMANGSSNSSSGGGGSSVTTRGLSGAARVAVLRGIARATGVGSLSVGLGQIQLVPPAADMGQAGTGTRAAGTGLGRCPEGGKGSVHSLTIKVQFGADAAAAARFVELCHSLASLVAACPELAAALVDSAFSSPAADAVQLKPEQDHNTSSRMCAGSSSRSADAAATAGRAASEVEAAAVALYHIAAVDVVDLLRIAAANTRTAATPNQDNLLLLKQPQQQQGTATAVSEQQHGPGAVDQGQPNSSESSMQAQSSTRGFEPSGADTVAVEASALSVASCDVVATNSSSAELSVVEHDGVPDAAAAVIPLPYAHYRLVGEDGRMLERPDKHPFALSRVLYDARELPSSDCEVWYEAADGAYRWRQTSSTVFLQLHALPDSITTAKELSVTIAPYSLRVLEQGSGELLFEAELARGTVPEESTWVFVKPERRAHGSSSRGTAGVAATGSRSVGLSAGALMLTGATAGGPTNSTTVNGQHILFELSKMNLELYERPNQHSASWWPRLFADDAADIAWDDASKDYSDLPPAIAAAAAAEAAREDELRREQQERQEARNKTQVLVDRHKQYRAERLRELKAAAWNAAARSSSSMECGAGSECSTSSNTSNAGSVLAAELSV